LDSNNKITNEQYLPELSNGFGYILADDTFVFVNKSTIRTYAITNGNWTLIQEMPSNGLATYYKVCVHADSKSMSGFSTNLAQTNGTIYYWTRNADLTWSLASSIDFDNTIHPSWARWVEAGTIFVGDPGNRFLRIYTKNNNGEWTYQNYDQSLAGITGVGYFPSMSVLIDANTAVFSAPQDGYTLGDTRMGASVVMTRVNGVWNFTTVFKADRPLYMFSAGLAINDYDLVFYSVVTTQTTTFYTLPLADSITPNGSGSNSPLGGNIGPSSTMGPNGTPSLTSGSTSVMQYFSAIILLLSFVH
jgi:hypothetical protein